MSQDNHSSMQNNYSISYTDEHLRLIDEAIERVIASVAGTSGSGNKDEASSSNQDGAGTSGSFTGYRLPDLDVLDDDYWYWDKKLSPQIVDSEVQFHSQTALILEDNLIGHDSPVIRGSKALTEHTIAYWKITVPHVYNAALFIGVGTIGCKIKFQNHSYHVFSAGLHQDIYGISPDGQLHNKNGIYSSFCPTFLQAGELHTVEVLFDGPHRKLSFAINQGQMITMDDEIDTSLTLFPVVASISARTVLIVSDQKCRQDPQPLLNHCITKILSRIPEKKVIKTLPLPDHMLSLLVSRAHNTPDAIINFDLTNFIDFMSVYPDNEKITHRLSESTQIYGLPWKILVMPRLSAEYSGGNAPPAKKPRTDLSEKSLGFFIQCNADARDNVWRCTATSVLCVRSQKNGVKNYTRHIAHTFSKEEDDWGYSRFLSADYLANPENGYIKDNTVKLSVQIWAQPPYSSTDLRR